jgi:hypothetical protein
MWVWALCGSRHFKPAAYSVQPQLPHRGELIIVSLACDVDIDNQHRSLPECATLASSGPSCCTQNANLSSEILTQIRQRDTAPGATMHETLGLRGVPMMSF